MPDARGHGLSDAPASGYSNQDHARDIAGLIQALDLDKPAVGGHSMGAATTLRLVADYPDLASCAILEDPPMWSAGPPAAAPGRPNPRESIRRTVLDAQSSDLQTTINRGKTEHPSWSDEEWQPWADAKKHVSTHFLDEMATVPAARNWRDLLARVQSPDAADHLGPRARRHRHPEASAEAQQILPIPPGDQTRRRRPQHPPRTIRPVPRRRQDLPAPRTPGATKPRRHLTPIHPIDTQIGVCYQASASRRTQRGALGRVLRRRWAFGGSHRRVDARQPTKHT